MTIVVDASVALKWYLSEHDSEAALALLTSGERLIAPDLIVAELCNAAWRLIRRGELRAEQLAIIARGVADAFATLHGSGSLATRSAAIALELDHPVYDCFYLALSETRNAPLITADRRLILKADGTSFAQRTLDLSGAADRR
jgi:predicted nucleic acid-binding protein